MSPDDLPPSDGNVVVRPHIRNPLKRYLDAQERLNQAALLCRPLTFEIYASIAHRNWLELRAWRAKEACHDPR